MGASPLAGNDRLPLDAGTPAIGIPRRAFLTAASGAVLSQFLASARDPARAADAETPPVGTELRQHVVETRVPPALSGGRVDVLGLGEAFDAAFARFVGAGSSAEAWRRILSPIDVVGLKFNRSGQGVIGTTDAVADVLIGSLVRAGWTPDQIVPIEAPATVVSRWGTRPAVMGYGDAEVDFGSGQDQLASVVAQVTAIINVPYLKTHNIAGITCAMKNLSHGLVKHPARYHRNGCAPYISDIIAIPALRQKVRLHLVDALRVVFDRGPDPAPDTIHENGGLLIGQDALLVDLVGLNVLNEIRRARGMDPVARYGRDVPCLAAAMQARGGVIELGDVDHVRLGV